MMMMGDDDGADDVTVQGVSIATVWLRPCSFFFKEFNE